MRYFVIWILAGFASIALTALVFFPAIWIVPIVERQTAGNLTLYDAQGTLWRGSAIIGYTSNGSDVVTPLLPGRLSWRFSPILLLGQIDAELENTVVLSRPVRVTGSWHQWQINSAAILLPSERLVTLGAPLNTVQPSGQMRLSWEPLQLVLQGEEIEIVGSMNLEINDIASRLSPIKPLGSYSLAFEWHGRRAFVTLRTAKGPVLLSGSGLFADGRLHFSGKAEAEAGYEERLANLLNLLGQRRREGGKDVIALEFK